MSDLSRGVQNDQRTATVYDNFDPLYVMRSARPSQNNSPIATGFSTNMLVNGEGRGRLRANEIVLLIESQATFDLCAFLASLGWKVV